MLACIASYVLISGISQQYVEAQIMQTGKQPACNCVIFRLDDIHDNWLRSAQIQVMNLFLSKDQSLSVGIVMNATGSDGQILQKIKEGQGKGLFELAIHGWNHVDYTKLSEQDQEKTLALANNKMQTLFGVKSNIFIPPYGTFNNSTLIAMSNVGIGILSAGSSHTNDNRFIWNPSVSSEPYSILQFPDTTGFMDERNGTWQNVSNSVILDSVNNSIAKRGYAIVVLHPQNFVRMVNGQLVDTIDNSQVSNLSSLIDSILAKKIHITTFENIAVSDPPPSQVQPIANVVKESDVTLKEKRTEIQDMIHDCHLEIKNASHNHKQVAHDCKAQIKKAKGEYRDFQKQLKSEWKQASAHIKKSKHTDE